MRHAAGRSKEAWAPVRRPGALCGASDDRGQDPKTRTAHARQHPASMPRNARRAGSKAARRRRGTPNGPAGLRSGQRQRQTGSPIFYPVDFIAFNRILHYCFFYAYRIKLSWMRFPTDLRVQNRQIAGQKYLSLPNVKAKINCMHAFNAINATQAPHPGARLLAGTGGGAFRAAWGGEETARPWQSRRWHL